MKIKQAMILSAGLGTRMGALTKELSKSMMLVDGVSLIERHVQNLYRNGIKKIIINTFYKAEILEEFIKELSLYKELEIYFLREDELLGTGGGVKNALKILKDEPFFLINNDAMFVDTDAENSVFKQLEMKWDPLKMKAIILLAKKEKAFGFRDKGDFNINELGQLDLDKENGLYIHAGIRILDSRCFTDISEKVFQLIAIYKNLIAERSLYGSIYEGDWLHIGDKKAYDEYHQK